MVFLTSQTILCKIISTHRAGYKEEGMISLLHYLDFGYIDGVLTACADEDRLYELTKELHITIANNRIASQTVLIFSECGKSKYMYYGKHNFTFWSDPVEQRVGRSNLKSMFALNPKVRLLDMFHLYITAAMLAKTTCQPRGEANFLHLDYSDCLFNCTVAEGMPLKLLEKAVALGDLRVISYLLEEVPLAHRAVLQDLIPDLSVLLASASELNSAPSSTFQYRLGVSCGIYGSYHDSFERMLMIRIAALRSAEAFQAKKNRIEAELEYWEKQDALKKAEFEKAGDNDDLRSINALCDTMDQIARRIAYFKGLLEQLIVSRNKEIAEHQRAVEDAYLI